MTFYASRIETRAWDGEVVEVHCPADELADLSVQVSNANAFDLLRFVGIKAEGCGTRPAGEVEGACLIALGMRGADEDRALPVRASGGHGQAHMIECGRREGYLRERADQLRELAQAARAGGYSVSWV